MSKVWTPEMFREKLNTNDKLVERSILRLFEFQTQQEQLNFETEEHNGVGFNGPDAKFMSSLAVQIKDNKYGNAEGKRLTHKQREIARRKLMKYTKQLLSTIPS